MKHFERIARAFVRIVENESLAPETKIIILKRLIKKTKGRRDDRPEWLLPAMRYIVSFLSVGSSNEIRLYDIIYSHLPENDLDTWGGGILLTAKLIHRDYIRSLLDSDSIVSGNLAEKLIGHLQEINIEVDDIKLELNRIVSDYRDSLEDSFVVETEKPKLNRLDKNSEVMPKAVESELDSRFREDPTWLKGRVRRTKKKKKKLSLGVADRTESGKPVKRELITAVQGPDGQITTDPNVLLEIAIEQNDSDRVLEALNRGADVNWIGRNECGMLAKAIFLQRHDIIKILLKKDCSKLGEILLPMTRQRLGDDPSEGENIYVTPLQHLANSGDDEGVKILLNHDVLPEEGDATTTLPLLEKGCTALQYAVRGGHERVLRLFVDREGANLDLILYRIMELCFYDGDTKRNLSKLIPTIFYLLKKGANSSTIFNLEARGLKIPNCSLFFMIQSGSEYLELFKSGLRSIFKMEKSLLLRMLGSVIFKRFEAGMITKQEQVDFLRVSRSLLGIPRSDLVVIDPKEQGGSELLGSIVISSLQERFRSQDCSLEDYIKLINDFVDEAIIESFLDSLEMSELSGLLRNIPDDDQFDSLKKKVCFTFSMKHSRIVIDSWQSNGLFAKAQKVLKQMESEELDSATVCSRYINFLKK